MRMFRLDDPVVTLVDDVEEDEHVSGWSTEADAEALAELAAGESGLTVKRLMVPCMAPVAVLGPARVSGWFLSGRAGFRWGCRGRLG
ncbi:hypothetical protein AB0I68_35895 [Streptomyces sp. NPDC050448]|uniref:hypothetical protein n=1 Tax=Streptomyces sp. NPDC050448 TaxID=3155404 RepID=UPI003425FF88